MATKIIAEIGTAHGGNLEKAYRLIDGAVQAGADIIKFQGVYADEILHPDTGFVKLPGGSIPLYQRFRDLEVSPDFFASCLEYTHKAGAEFVCTPFGLRSLRELVAIKPDAIKIASPEVNHIPLLNEASAYYNKIPIILSSGVSTLGDIEKAVSILTQNAGGAPAKQNALTLLHCITFYPAPEDEYNVRCVKTLGEIFGTATGISDHSLNPVLVPVLSTAMGGTMIEKHITLSKKTDGLDDPVALELDQFAQMVHAVHQADAVLERYRKDQEASGIAHVQILADGMTVSAAQGEIIRQMQDEFGKEKVLAILGSGIKRLAPAESANYGRTNRSIHYMTSLRKGHSVSRDDVSVLRTEKVLTPGIHPDFLETIIGRTLTHDVDAGAGVQLTDFMNP